MEIPKPTRQHAWLKQLVGDWTFTHECQPGGDAPPMRASGTESVRLVGDLWVVCEGKGDMPGGSGTFEYVTTLGYDPARERFVGTWVGSMMASMFVYEGRLESDGVTLPLNTEGPGMDDPTALVSYQDVMAVHADGRRTLTSRLRGADGGWTQFMHAVYTRTGG